MKARMLVLMLAASAALASPAFPQRSEGTAADQAYFRAYYWEKALRDYEAAETGYNEVIRLASASRELPVHIQAVLGRGRCLLPLGRKEEAIGAFKWVLAADPENEEAKALLARELDTAAKDEDLLGQRIQGLVVKLGGAERDQAMKDLRLVGNRAVHRLAMALRSRGVGVVEGAARTLALLGTQESYSALAGGFSDKGVVFPKALGASLNYINRAGRGGLEVYLAAMEHSNSEQRSGILQALNGKLSLTSYLNEATPRTLARILDLGLSDPSPETKVAVLQILQRVPAAFNTGGHDPLGDEAWIGLITSDESNVSWNAARAVLALRSSRTQSWSPELCRAFVDALLDIAAGRRSAAQASYYYPVLAMPAHRQFRTEDLLELLAAVASSENFPDNDRRGLLDRITQFLIEARGADKQALAELARDGWSKIQAPDGREAWLERFSRSELLPKDLLLESAGAALPRVRRIAYRSLFKNRAEYTAEEIEGALTRLEEDLLGSDQETRQALLYLMYYTPVPKGVEALRELRRRETEARTRSLALQSLYRALGEEALPDVRADLLGDDWEGARDLLVKQLGVKAVPELISLAERLQDGALPVTKGQGTLIVPAEVAREYVARLPEEMRNQSLVSAVASVLTPEARVELVIQALTSNQSSLVYAGARLAGIHHVEQAWPYLIPLLDATDGSTRGAAQTALTAIRTYRELKASFAESGPGGSAQVLEDALALTKSKDPLKRRGGALALGALGNKAGLPALLTLLDDPDNAVRDAALSALERLGGKARPPEKE